LIYDEIVELFEDLGDFNPNETEFDHAWSAVLKFNREYSWGTRQFKFLLGTMAEKFDDRSPSPVVEVVEAREWKKIKAISRFVSCLPAELIAEVVHHLLMTHHLKKN
jgi:hypothetical protein